MRYLRFLVDSTVIEPSTTDPDVFHTKDEAFEYYEIRNPRAGDWTLHVYGADLPPEGEPVTVIVSACPQAAGDATGDPCNGDDDSDGLTDESESLIYLTDPLNPDTDADGLNDGDEIDVHGTNPLVADTDGDVFSDGAELFVTTDPLAACAATGVADGVDNDGDTAVDELGEGANDESPDAWPPDADDDQDSDIGDLMMLFGGGKLLIGSDNPLYQARTDFAGDGDLDSGDVLKGFRYTILKRCG